MTASEMATSRMSVIERLASLPDVFDLGIFHLKTGIDRASAKVMLSRWAAKGYVELAGPKAGIYFKRLGSTMDRSEQIAAAVSFLYPSSTVCGATILHRAAWTTQIPRQLHVAIETRPSVVLLNDVVLHERRVDWFKLISAHDGFEAQSIQDRESMRALKPAWALADMYAQRDGWVPDEDDLDLPEDDKTQKAIAQAQETLGSENEEFTRRERYRG
jgi:hypothetical protein